MEKLIVDRIEEGYAVVEKEDLSHITLPVSQFTFPVAEGDILLFDGEKYMKSETEKDERKQKLLLIQQKLKEKSKNK
ncbi:MAG: DUF3006 domain-containing protein [Clostridia bacterium]|nr:DUF3006 domain-containing protein [Clostridia bacterium]